MQSRTLSHTRLFRFVNVNLSSLYGIQHLIGAQSRTCTPLRDSRLDKASPDRTSAPGSSMLLG